VAHPRLFDKKESQGSKRARSTEETSHRETNRRGPQAWLYNVLWLLSKAKYGRRTLS
jgi:hypothetical protein